ncbi:LytR/AlgR family response regulator transcription factor [Capnocytophaga catalasegens]|uniref:DNA-binding response regulator n=1 Tax=Capnocytophaga catalasegens TaxID=1004260 RepID=A0AAV5AY16_9FLAO|nr:LytTR family DNA-binding domain-containing protein [Capnocytophaga catalasegens]GIZ15346.1 DNA-binding response regulator [Capnocytophaga catalasegens]GJM50513.1 DNA-binding response regulator [Capnocytophaga catalasegens]GJM52117.1 DNA-binding response regulator [Capnocytophaga catalasegens]
MKVYILEDEIKILKYIISLVETSPYLQIIGYSSQIEKAQYEIPILKPELILSDIQLSDGSSFSLFEKIDISDSQIIFITAYNQFAIDALNLGAFAYLLKPIDEELFNKTIERCFHKQEQHKFDKNRFELMSNYSTKQTINKIALKSFDYTQIISISAIIYCHSDKGYTTFYLENNTNIVVCKVLKEYETLLPKDIFIRCHQSYLVNVNYISKYYKDGNLELTNKKLIPVSERRKEFVLDFLNHLI